MADAAILCGALERIGWSVKSRNAFTDEGFDSIQSLSHVTRTYLKTVCKSIRSAPDPVRIGFYQEYKLYALHLWVTTRLLQGQVVQGQQYTDAIALEYASKVCRLEESKKEDEEGLVKFPEAFGKETSWRTFEKVLRNYLGMKKGINSVPLEYIMRNVDGPGLAGQVYATEHEHLVVTTPLEGEAFEADNGKVWLVLKDLTLIGPAFAYISHLDRLRHGRAAIKALRAHYKGDSAMSQTKAQVYNTIKNASYSGEKRNWTFDMYVTLHQKSHQTLEEYGKPVPPAKQARDLIDGIDRSNGMMAAALATLLATNNLHEDFQAASGYLCNFVAANKNENQTRNISGVGRGGRGGAGRGQSGGQGSG